MKICSVCGRNYNRQFCEFCKREKEWNESGLNKFRQTHFTKRMIYDLSRLTITTKKIQSAYLVGKNASGKTLQACSMLEVWKKNKYIENQKVNVQIIHVAELLYQIKQTFDPKNEDTEKGIIEKFSNLDFLILDELGIEKTTDWSLQVLYLILSLEDLENELGDARITSRISAMCKTIEM